MAEPGVRGRPPSGQIRKEPSTVAGHAAADCPVVVRKPGNAGGAKGTGHPGLGGGQLPVQEEAQAKPRPKPFAISKQVVWEAYYGHIYRSALLPLLRNLNEHLARWARRKYKRLTNSRDRAYRLLRRVHRQEPTLFAHWRLGERPWVGWHEPDESRDSRPVL